MPPASARMRSVGRWTALLLPLLAIQAMAQPGREMLVNGGFDLDEDHNGLPDGWSTSGQQALYRETMPHSRDFELVSRPGAYVLATQDVRLVPGETYTLVIEVKGTPDALAGAIILHGPARPTHEMGLIWSQAVKPDYQVFFRVFQAPNPACRLYLYNVARKGEVVYRRVSLRQGRPEQPLVRQLSFGPNDEPDEPARTTAHTPFARPLSGGPLKTLAIMRHFRSAREVVELAQRVELDWDLLVVDADDAASPTAQQAQRRLDQDEYDLYLVACPVPKPYAERIRKAVAGGRGLVVLDTNGRGAGLCDPAGLVAAGGAHWLLRDLPWSLLEPAYQPAVRYGPVGQGRAVLATWPAGQITIHGLLPTLRSLADWRHRGFRYWEYPSAFLARALAWAARRDQPTALAVSANETGLLLSPQNLPAGSRLEVNWRSARQIRFDRSDLTWPPAAPGAGGVVAYPPDLPGGPGMADVRVLAADGRVVYWAGLPFERPREGALADLALSAEVVEPGAGVTVSARSTATTATTVTAALVDARGRVYARSRADVAPQASFRLALSVARTLTAGNKLCVRLARADGRELDSAWRDVWVPALNRARAWTDFHVTAWGDGSVNPPISHTYNQMSRELGLNGKFEGFTYGTVEDGLFPSGTAHLPGLFPGSKPRPDRTRGDGCLSDPAFLARTDAAFAKRLTDVGPLGMSAWALGDEIELTSRHDVDEVDFAPASLAAFRAWLQRRYGDLATLNRQWGTNYARFDEVRPAVTGDVRGRSNYAPFVDFRTFMTEEWIRTLKHIVANIKSADPGARVGHTNTFGSLPFNGVDFWRLTSECGFTWGQEYSEAIKSEAHKAIFAFWRSFCPDDLPNLGWIGYHRQARAAQFEPWWLALHGSRGVSYFAVNALDAQRGTSWALVYPTQATTPYARAVRSSLSDLTDGVGKLLMESREPDPAVAILWSHPSMLASWCESTYEKPEPPDRPPMDSWGAFFRAQLDFRRLLEANQVPYRYLAPAQIAADPTVLNRYRLVYLPMVSACDRATVQSLVAWQRQGGLVVADLNTLRYDEHGTPYPADGPVTDLFGVRTAGPVVWSPTRLTGALTAAGYGRQPWQAVRPTTEWLGGPVNHEAGPPAALATRLDRGSAVILSTILNPDDAGAVSLVGRLLQAAGITPTLRLTRLDDPAKPTACEVVRRVNGTIELVGVIRDYRRVAAGEAVPPPLRLSFGRPAWVVDVRERKLLGRIQQLDLGLAPADCRLFALLPYRPERLDVEVSPTGEVGHDLELTATLRADGAVGRHVFRVELRAPDGQLRPAYSTNTAAAGGRLKLNLPLAYNDPAGDWTATVRDVTSGLAANAKFRLTEAPPG